MIKVLMVLTLVGVTLQVETKFPAEACNMDECNSIFQLDLGNHGLTMDVEDGGLQEINIIAINFAQRKVPLLLKVDEGKLFATIGECEGDHFYENIYSLQGRWAIKLDRDKIQVSYNGQMVIYYDFDEDDCSAMLKNEGFFLAFYFAGLPNPDLITLRQIVPENNDCPYGHYPDTSKCMRDGEKCHAMTMVYCSCAGLFGWDDKLCEKTERVEPKMEEVPCFMCPGGDHTCNDWEWEESPCEDHGDGCKQTKHPMRCRCDDGCDRRPEKETYPCGDCVIHSASSPEIPFLFLVAASVAMLG